VREPVPQATRITGPQSSSWIGKVAAGKAHPRPTPEAVDAVAVPRERSELVSRILNFTLALGALVALTPLMVIIAVLVKATSRGPIFYSQTRVGLDRRRGRPVQPEMQHRRQHDLGGRAFTIYKFRTMCVNAEHLTGAVWATKADPRVTPIGKHLRKYRLDELPQLLNVLLGDMNIVGPRPERPSIFADLRRTIPTYEYRQQVRPGITGLAQVNQQYDTSLDDVRQKVRYDLEYIGRQSLVEDIRIMLQTVPVILFKRGGW
jgi:lipopolysaccharide/colanic/teichoic acid biosynthesis glycosyltransferase